MSSTYVRSESQRALAQPSRRGAIKALFAIVAFGSLSAYAQDGSALKGDYVGSLDGRPVRLHISITSKGTLRGTFDNPVQGKSGMPISDIKLEGSNLSFKVPVAQGSWKGLIQKGGAILAGAWSTVGEPIPLTFQR
jgi:hypothetical protein